MQIIPQIQQIPSNSQPTNKDSLNDLVALIGTKTQLPNQNRNYCIFNNELVQQIASKKEQALPLVTNFLSKAKEEKQIAEGLYILDRMIENKTQGIEKTYPIISKFNNTSSPNVQVILAGIYRKTQIPDAFGPLTKMMLKQTFQPNSPFFDPTEEIGGAILDYLRVKSAPLAYNQKALPPANTTNPPSSENYLDKLCYNMFTKS